MGRNVLARKKLRETIKTIKSPFTAREMSDITGLEPKRVSRLLREFDEIEIIPVAKRLLRVVYRYNPVSS